VEQNLTLPSAPRLSRFGWMRRAAERALATRAVADLRIKTPGLEQRVVLLSGGNQQKVVIAKWFETQPRALLLHEPTQGVDVGARAQIFERLRAAAQEGMLVLYASGEWEDLAHLCDRVLVFRDGRVVTELRGGELTKERIAEQSFRKTAEVA